MSHSMTARRISILSMGVSAALAALKITVGWLAGSTAVVADGVEAAGDVVASAVVFFGLALAAMPFALLALASYARAEAPNALTNDAAGVDDNNVNDAADAAQGE